MQKKETLHGGHGGLFHADSPYVGRWEVQSELLIEIQNHIFAFDFLLLICPQRHVLGGLMTQWTSVHGPIFTPIVKNSLPPAADKKDKVTEINRAN